MRGYLRTILALGVLLTISPLVFAQNVRVNGVAQGGGGGGGGANPAGSGSEVQYRFDATTFGAITGSSWDGTNLTIPSANIGVAATAATATLVISGTAPANGSTITIGSVTYTFLVTLTGSDNEIHIGSSAQTHGRLWAAINARDGLDSGQYKVAAANPDVMAFYNPDGSLTDTLVARVTGVVGNSIALASTTIRYVVPATLSSGTDGVLFHSVATEYAAFGVGPVSQFLLPNISVDSIVNIVQDNNDQASFAIWSANDYTSLYAQVQNGGYAYLKMSSGVGYGVNEVFVLETTLSNFTIGNGGFQFSGDANVFPSAMFQVFGVPAAFDNSVTASDFIDSSATGTGTQFACFDSTGKLVRSPTSCGS